MAQWCAACGPTAPASGFSQAGPKGDTDISILLYLSGKHHDGGLLLLCAGYYLQLVMLQQMLA